MLSSRSLHSLIACVMGVSCAPYPQPPIYASSSPASDGGQSVRTADAQPARAMTDGERGDKVLDVAARDLECARTDVAIVMTFDRRFGNSYSLRYLVDGCGQRALYGEDCSKMTACEYIIASRMPLPAKR
jgi:hypothetical protein